MDEIKDDFESNGTLSDIDAEAATRDKILLASTLVIDSQYGLHSDYKVDPKSLRLYLVYRHWSLNYGLNLLLIVHHSLALFEHFGPRIKIDSPWENLTLTIELLCLFYYGIRLILLGSIIPAYKFWHDNKNIVLITTIGITLLDIVLYLSLPHQYAVRWSPAIRPLFIVNFAENRQVRRAIRNIRNTLPDIINVLILFFLSVATFAIIALKLFEKRDILVIDGHQKYIKNSTYFTNYPDIFYQLYVLVTTANNPDVMMPAYNQNRLFAIFFVIFIIINLYLFMNIILAVIYNNYRKHLKNEVKSLLFMKKDSLTRAFSVLTANCSVKTELSDGESGIKHEEFKNLMDIVFNSSVTLKKSRHTSSVIEVFWTLLQVDGRITKKCFLKLSELLNMEIRVTSDSYGKRLILEKMCPSFYNHRYSAKFRTIVRSKYFRYTFDSLIFLNAILIAIELENRLKHFEWFLLFSFSFEILAKIYAFGFKKFIQKFWNIFDTIVIGSAVIFWMLIEMKAYPERDLEQSLDLILILRILRLCKLIGTIKRFKVVVITVQSLLPSIMTYGGLLFVVFYFYAIIGIKAFAGLIYGNSKGCDTDTIHCCPVNDLYSSMQYCTLNFNDMANAMLFLFDLMVVNQWHILAKNVEDVTGSKWSRLYFMSFHLICVIIVLNIFTAFVLEAFILEYTTVTEGSALKNDLLSKIQQLGMKAVDNGNKKSKRKEEDELDLVDADHDLELPNSSIDTKLRRTSVIELPNCQRVIISEVKSVEMLLLRMFQGEIDSET